jgi:hypothetical protein
MEHNHNSRWLSVFCPDDNCLTEEEHIMMSPPASEDDRSLWLDVFCPEQRCEISSPSQLP